jgi:four helix bundle protein
MVKTFGMTPEAMKERTQDFAIAVIQFCRRMAPSRESGVIIGQLIRCSASVGANYRSALQARSRREFIARIGVVLEEADETLFWLELVRKTGSNLTGLEDLIREARQLLAIFVATRRTAQRNARTGPRAI